MAAAFVCVSYDGANFAEKLGLEQLFFRIGKAEVGKHIAAARGYLFVHRCHSPHRMAI